MHDGSAEAVQLGLGVVHSAAQLFHRGLIAAADTHHPVQLGVDLTRMALGLVGKLVQSPPRVPRVRAGLGVLVEALLGNECGGCRERCRWRSRRRTGGSGLVVPSPFGLLSGAILLGDGAFFAGQVGPAGYRVRRRIIWVRPAPVR